MVERLDVTPDLLELAYFNAWQVCARMRGLVNSTGPRWNSRTDRLTTPRRRRVAHRFVESADTVRAIRLGLEHRHRRHGGCGSFIGGVRARTIGRLRRKIPLSGLHSRRRRRLRIAFRSAPRRRETDRVRRFLRRLFDRDQCGNGHAQTEERNGLGSRGVEAASVNLDTTRAGWWADDSAPPESGDAEVSAITPGKDCGAIPASVQGSSASFDPHTGAALIFTR